MFKKNKNKQIQTVETKKINPFSDFDGHDGLNTCPMVFATGVGRSGTHFLAQLFNQHSNINALHLDEVNNSVADSFWQYARWYGLPIDYTPFYISRSFLAKKSTKNGKIYFEANPYLSLEIKHLSDHFSQSKFLIVIRDARKVVLSHLNKGWYKNFNPVFDVQNCMAPGYHYNINRPNHFFGRIVPKNPDELNSWKSLTQVGKIAWMWQAINNTLMSSIKNLSPEKYRIIQIDDFDYNYYLKILDFLEITNSISENQFDIMKKIKPGRTKKSLYNAWNRQEENEFLAEIRKLVY